MSFRSTLSRKTGISEAALPGSYQILGHVFLAKMLRMNDEEKKKAARMIMAMFPRVKTVCEIRGVDGELREPLVRKIAGDGTETVVKEHGIVYKMDAAKIMFSKGNHAERQRVTKHVTAKEVVIDMFAGIGYFTLGVAKKALRVIAVEKNPLAFRYLTENIALNKLENVKAINADNRTIIEEDVADRIIMGYFPGTATFIPFAIKMLKPRGTIHYHNVCEQGKEQDDFAQFAKELGFSYRVLLRKKVKDFGPRKIHYVMDVEVRKVRNKEI